jgi:hypothetical protein
MRRPRAPRQIRSHGRLAGLLGAVLLLLQGLIPAAAIAYDHGPQLLTPICTPAGPEAVRLPGDHRHGFGGLACEQCVMASLMATAAPEPPPVPPPQDVRFSPGPEAASSPAGKPGWAVRPPSRGPPVQA